MVKLFQDNTIGNRFKFETLHSIMVKLFRPKLRLVVPINRPLHSIMVKLFRVKSMVIKDPKDLYIPLWLNYFLRSGASRCRMGNFTFHYG